MHAVCNKTSIGSAFENWIMNLILKIRLVEREGKLKSHHHGYCMEVAMDEINWKDTSVSIIPLSKSMVFYSQYLWQTDSDIWNYPEWNQIIFT